MADVNRLGGTVTLSQRYKDLTQQQSMLVSCGHDMTACHQRAVHRMDDPTTVCMSSAAHGGPANFREVLFFQEAQLQSAVRQ